MFPMHMSTFPMHLTSGPSCTYKMCKHAVLSIPARRADKHLQCDYNAMPALFITLLSPLQCQVTQQHDTTLLTECSMVGDKARRAHTVEDIICYS
jgi:hypothetical protein